MTKTTLNYTDPETGDPVELDVTGWQLVIDCPDGEIARLDLVRLALMVKLRFSDDDAFRCSLVRPDGTLLHGDVLAPEGNWVDFFIEKRET